MLYRGSGGPRDTMKILEQVSWAFVVVDPNDRVVAKARQTGTGIWIVRLYGASWLDTMTDETQRQWYKKLGLRPNCSPDLKVAKTKTQARKILKQLCESGQS